MTSDKLTLPHACQEVQDRFSAYLDGELPEDVAAAVRRHLEGCPRCRQEFASWQRLWELLAAGPEPEVPPDLSARILARLTPPRRRRWADLALAASFLLGILLGGKLGLGLYEATAQSGAADTAEMELLAETPVDSWGLLLANGNGDNGT